MLAERSVDEVLAPVRAMPLSAGILSDFDGTLSPIVDDPATAKLVPGAADLLAALARQYALVAVLSGRPVAFLAEQLPPSVSVSGLYGLEVLANGQRRDHPSAGAWREVIDDVATTSRASGPEGMRVEAKGLSLTLHYRGHPELEPSVTAWAEQQAARSGLTVRAAKMSVELHPPIAADKGTALRDLTDGLTTVLYLGDDLGDLPAFDQLDALQASGLTTVRVAVRSDEVPNELVERADIAVDGPEGVVSLLAALL